MSSPSAIAAVTSTLRYILEAELKKHVSSVTVTTRPPDKVLDKSKDANRVNLFLYQTAANAAWRNMDLPAQVKPGEIGKPPLALNLYYLITAYSETQDYPDPTSHYLLGLAMSVFHDYSILQPRDIKAVGSYDLYNQIERIRITPHALSIDEMSKLWTTFQTNYRISTAYEVSVVLIESTQPIKSPLPVLTIGERNTGVTVQPNLVPPYPMLYAIESPNPQSSIQFGNGSTILGDTFVLKGDYLGNPGDTVVVRFTHPRLQNPIDLTASPSAITPKQIALQLPNNPSSPDLWLAGFYNVTVQVKPTGKLDFRSSNELSLSLAPRILTLTPNPATRDAAGNVTLSLTCSPPVLPDQRVLLLVGDREIPAKPHSTTTTTLEFDIDKITAGDYFLRLRIDGVDSLLVIRTGTPPRLEFDSTQRVTIS